jgi:hypothetical protein
MKPFKGSNDQQLKYLLYGTLKSIAEKNKILSFGAKSQNKHKPSCFNKSYLRCCDFIEGMI